MKYIYIAGPISKGDQFLNVRKAIDAAHEVSLMGLIPFIPHQNFLWHMFHPKPYEVWMDYDFDWIRRCDALLRIPGENSGSDREVAFASKLGLPIFLSLDQLRGHLDGLKKLEARVRL